MGVQTTADRLRDEAKDHLSDAYKCLLAAIDEDTYGSEDFNKEYVGTVEESLVELSRIKRKL